jgi:iron(III) transport system substrate-binding protein
MMKEFQIMNILPHTRFLAGFLAILALAGNVRATSAQTTDIQFYTTVPRNLSEPLAQRFTELNPNFKVNVFQAGVETVLEKMQLEVRGTGRFQADVMWIEEPAAIRQFAEEGRLEPYQSAELKNVLAAYRDPEGRFVANHVAHIFLMYNTNKIPSNAAPKSWADLTDKRFINQLVFSNPQVSGTGATIASAMVQKFGWSFWESVAKLKPVLVGGSQGMTSLIIQGERTVGAIHDYTIADAMQKKQPINFVVPTEGGLALPAYFAITLGTPKMDAAKKFYDFVISKDGATLLLNLGMYHTRTDMPGPEGRPPIAEVKTMSFDWAQHARDKAAMKVKFADIMEK